MDRDIERKLDEVIEQVAGLSEEVKGLDGRYVSHTDLTAYLTVAMFDDRVERLTVDVLGKVTKSMQAMFNDAVKEATTLAIESYTETDQGKQWFREALAEDRAQARKERLQDMGRYLTMTRAAVLWIVPIVTILSTLGQIFGWW